MKNEKKLLKRYNRLCKRSKKLNHKLDYIHSELKLVRMEIDKICSINI